jgi:VWFA-related protein
MTLVRWRRDAGRLIGAGLIGATTAREWFAARAPNRAAGALAIFGGVALALAAGASAQNTTPDPNALLARGVQLIESRPAEAVKLLQQALRLDPELPALRYQLGIAFHAIGDEADAEAELREAVSRTPDSAAAHNYLGIVLFQMGDAKAALEEFRAAAKLAPKDPNAHFNLGEALARTGDGNSAVEELRVAAGLIPGDAGLARLVKVVETALAARESAPPEGAIKVDVRQVLVPVVVTDPQGHHVTGLMQADFRVFEDGVEQKITAFSVESSGLPQADIPAQGEPSPAAPAVLSAATPQAASPQAASPQAPRRTYMILIDTLHASFNNFVSAREALVKLFQQEHSADSQYVVVALGASAEMVLNVTPDPLAVLAVFQSKRFQKIFIDGQQGGLKAEMERFRRDLTETRYACDLAATDSVFKIKCAAGIQRAPQQAQAIAELDRTLTVGFLRQFRSLVAQLARARDRRTIVLISDGFQIEPGREALALVNAFFPPASHCLVPVDVFCPPNAMQSTSRMVEEFEPILQLAAASNVTIDTIGSRGLYGQRAFDASNPGAPPSVDGAVGRAERDMDSAAGNTLAEIAEATGGTSFHDNNNLLSGLQRAFADGRDYYTIAYVPGNASFDGKFRAIAVQVRDPKAVVNAKRGYWAAPAGQ